MVKLKYLTLLVILFFSMMVSGCTLPEATFLYPANPDIKFLNEHPDYYIDKTFSLQGTVVKSDTGNYILNDSTGEIPVKFNRFLPRVGIILRITGVYKKELTGGVVRGEGGVGFHSIITSEKNVFYEENREILDKTPLTTKEVRSYNGNSLSSVEDGPDYSISGIQYVDINKYNLAITGLVNRKVVYTYDEALGKHPHFSKVVTLHSIDGWNLTFLWEGIRVRDLIADAVPDPRANTVIFTGHDGYTTSLPLDYLMKNEVIMAYRINNIPLPAEWGYPFILVAEDKWDYKWIMWIEKIELSDDPSYLGFWERRGYSITGNVNDS